MTVAELLDGAGLTAPLPESLRNVPVEGLEYDSRRIRPGYLFFAFPGAKVDGRAFGAKAVENGAIAVISELPAPEGFGGPWLTVEHGRAVLAIAARRFYNLPDRRLKLVGITGTNGKTTTSYLIDSILRAAGGITGLIGTIEYQLAGDRRPAVNTTPETLDLLRLFAELEDRGGTHVTMEVSSHALALRRVYGLEFHTAIFSNLTRDHLDFHQTMASYFAAKHLLFEGAGARPPLWSVVNYDDEYGRRIRPGDGSQVLSYGIDAGVVRPQGLHSGFDGLRFRLVHPGGSFDVASPLVGRINVYNILAACAAGLTFGLSGEVIARGIAECRAVPGRFERVEQGQPFLVVVDYAHTDDALRNVLAVARALNPRRLITLFGCGGDRDRAKRPLMGQAAAEGSDYAILTSDNPRSEDPLAIINDALVGLRRADTPHAVEPDRAKAIRLAIEEAGTGDIVILAGKGHETYQEVAGVKHPFDDREVARRVLAELGYPL
ncbi:MAG: UDP-N-acetylmuramoyl-L-alanyl-D-glutamate--2,6-diaminopimelate ligase [Bryobacteraceae bacterium]|nr:UDP-N-acetylmuramoyl-L-alanyl-D-glutamate--2,6-diaminopimelate ligase [Bryobacteraceae bacterium]